MMNESLQPLENPSILIFEHTTHGVDLLSGYLKELEISFAFLDDIALLLQAIDILEPGIIILDLDELGFDLTKITTEIRSKKNRTTTIVGLTERNIESIQYDCFEAGVDAILSKPVKKIELVGVITLFISDGLD